VTVRRPSTTPDAALVRTLLAEQYPHLADASIRPSTAAGSSNWVFRLGTEHAVRLPRSDDHVDDLLKEARHLPRVASAVTVPVPAVQFLGDPSSVFPRPWSVVTWIPGEPPGALDAPQQSALARSLGAFVRTLHTIGTDDLPAGPAHRGYRAGEPVTAESDRWVDESAEGLRDLFDPLRVRAAWSRLRREVPPPTGPPCWIHTDLSTENLLVDPNGRLTGVIDFGGLGIGDPAVDLLYGWGMFGPEARDVFRRESGADEATRLRGRAWTFAGPGLLTILSYRHTLPERTARLITMVEAAAEDVGVSLRG
jgi:aminoglycoside phosphotransferase (APT) family kinase protein